MDREIPLPNMFIGESPLHVAVRSGQVEDVRKVLDEQGVDINCLNSKHETPLHLACSLRQRDIVVLLIAFGADPYNKDSDDNNAYGRCRGEITDLMNKMLHHNNLWINGPDNTDGDTLLHSAVRQGDLANAQRLILKQNSSVNDVNACYETPLHLACALGHKPIVHLLATNGADMYKSDCYNNAPIHRAVAKGHVEVANLLIATFSCDPKVLTGYQGRTLLHFASAVGNIELITTTIEEYGISPLARDAISKTPLHIAACHGQEEVVSLLIAKYNSPVDCRSSFNDTPLHLACYCGHISCIKRLIYIHKADLSLCDDNGDTPLHKACMGGNVNIVRMLIMEYKADLSARDHQKSTPMHKAALRGHKDIVETLINAFQCNPHEKGYKGRSLLHHACEKGHTKLAVMLITEFQLDPCLADDSGNTPLHMACWGGHEELARLLITKYNCPVDVKNKQNETPLHKACGGGYINVVKMLVGEYKADLSARNNQKSTPMHLAALGGHKDIVESLINEFQCNPHEKGYDCRSLLHYACYKGHTKLAVMLITEFQLDPCLADDSGNTPLHMACQNGHEELARLLITKYNCSVDVKDKENETPLHKACVDGHINVVKMLIREYKADLSAHNYQKSTPMHGAALGGHKDVVELLINEFQCNPHEKGYDGMSLLHYACYKGHTKLAVMLITEFQLDPCLADDSGNTPLHMACWGGHEELARLLITKYNCPVDVKNKQNETPLHKACGGGYINVVIRLVGEYKADLSARNYQKSTPMHGAALGGHKDIVESLINEFQCNPHEKGYDGRSLLHCACEKGHTKLAVMLITEFQLDPCLADDSGNTPLHMACWGGHEELARLLITKYNCPVDVKNKQNETPLHKACGGGYINVVKRLVGEYKADLSARNYQKSTPMRLAALGGHKDIVESLINEFQCNPHEKGYDGRSLLHCACEKGHTKLAVMLITEFQLDPCLADDSGNTPLHMACWGGHEELARLLITKYNCPVDVKNKQKKTPLYIACTKGHVNVVRMLASDVAGSLEENPLNTAIDSGNTKAVHVLYTECGDTISIKGRTSKPFLHQVVYGGGSASVLRGLISNFGHDPACVDDDGNTLLHTAAQCGKYEIVQILTGELSGSCPIDSRNSQGQTPFHCACIGGHVRVIESLLSHKASVYIRDTKGHTPIKYAHLLQNNDVLFAVFRVLGFHSKIVDSQLLHKVCVSGAVEFIDYLLLDFELDPSTLKDKDRNSLLHTAVSCGRLDMARHFLEKYKLNVECRNSIGQTPLHLICSKAPANSVEGLLDLFIREYKADITSEDNEGNQPIHAAALAGHINIVSKLIALGCDANIRGFKLRSLLHLALANGNILTGKILINKFHLSVHRIDNDGNTPLHLSSLCEQQSSVKMLLYDYHVPVFVRNKAGKTALDLTKDNAIKKAIVEYMRSEHKSIQAEYKELQSLSTQKFSGERKITKVFVVGHPESGKSTLIESLKRRGIISSLFNISVTTEDVPLHTAGIVPSFFDDKHGGRCLYYDFAGDTEYYSSHSAILEIVSQSIVGRSVYIVVANLTKDIVVICNELGYWLSFVSYHAKVIDSAHKLKVVVVLSHYDGPNLPEASSKIEGIELYLKANSKNYNAEILDIVDAIPSNCCKPRSSKTIEDTLQRISQDTHPYSLSLESTLLHGLLEKDFKNVVACQFTNLVSHVKDTGIALPTTALGLHPIVKELHDIGLLMMIGRSDEPLENHLLLLNPCTLTNEVHQNLFSKTAAHKFLSILGPRYANMGIIPESCLHKLLPDHITKECLIQLQYCQEFSHTEVGLDYTCTVTPNASESKENLLYFPALCNLESKSASWSQLGDPDHTFRIGWYAKCKESFDYFPARFLHVILLRLAFTLALPSVAQAYGRRCTMWKNGIHWRMEEEVKCIFEMVDDNKGIVVITKAEECCDELYTTLGKIIDTVMQAKREFCNTALLQHFLLDSDDPQSFKNDDKLFEINDIERVIREGKKSVISVSGHKSIKSSQLLMLKKFSYWGKFKVPSLSHLATCICICL